MRESNKRNKLNGVKHFIFISSLNIDTNIGMENEIKKCKKCDVPIEKQRTIRIIASLKKKT